MANGTLPPLTAEQLRDAIGANDNHRSYVYIGAAQDTGWTVAENRQQMMAALKVYRAEAQSSVQSIWPEATGDVAALVFGNTAALHATLSRSQAEELNTVTQAIINASGGGS